MIVQRLGERKQRGFTLTELAIVLGIVGSVLGAIWVASARVSAANRSQKAAGQVIQIVSNYRSLYAQHGVDVVDDTDITCLGVSANFFPTDMVSSACTTGTASTYPTGPWAGGAVQIRANATRSAIDVTYYGLPMDACNGFANAASASPDLVYEDINGTAQTVPPTATAISSQCSTATGNSVRVMYKAR